MWFKGHEIEGTFDYVLVQNFDTGILDVFANILEKTENSVTIERFTNYGRHQLATVIKPLREFEFEYRRIKEEEKHRKECANGLKPKQSFER